MSTTSKIDFDPSLFDEDQTEPTFDLAAKKTKQRANYAPIIVIGGIGILLALVAVFFAIEVITSPKSTHAMPLESTEQPVNALLQPVPGLKQDGQIVQKTHAVDSDGFCMGSDVMCFISTTDKPAETLAKLAAVLPVGEDKRYRVKVSIVPLNE